ncbi:MAG: methyltransferase, partial [Myxococcales bacterium]|nr:methyltransferase [Myxococcales bacterium]
PRDTDLDVLWPEHAPFGPPEAIPPLALRSGRGATALVANPTRLRAWLEGWRRGDPSIRPRLLAEAEGALLLEPIGGIADARATLLARAVTELSVEGTRRSILDGLDPEVRLSRALGRLGLPRAQVDRWLDGRAGLTVAVLRPGLGGIGPEAWREADGRVVAVRWDRVVDEGWRALELAAIGAVEEGEAFELARLAVALGEGTRRGDLDGARTVAEATLGGAPEPAEVRVWIEGPAVIRGLWGSDGATVDARRARWLLQHVDGLSVAGAHVRVRVEPAIRKGRRPPLREPRAQRQRRLFARWAEGVRVDDEGLVGLTPEALALRIAARARGVVVDGTCGVGGLAIALARQPSVERVIAVDVSAERLALAAHNAAIYGVRDRIELVRGDVVEVLGARRADVLVLDPPWGGRGYDRERVALGDLGLDVEAALARFGGPVLLKLPRSFDPATLPEGDWRLELMLDEREVPKLLLAERAGLTSRRR